MYHYITETTVSARASWWKLTMIILTRDRGRRGKSFYSGGENNRDKKHLNSADNFIQPPVYKQSRKLFV